ncbi:hypothetical protein [Pseudomonas sp. NFR16]|uniref:hypothetical protein n=1 Tax=Pseudomonas sp. NFR16 TaxID=1566248 RepID=UPI0008D3D176|nr:hypothetical protein [Pseudomonas sp. NFR16]SEI45739.1 hypothetical protein SAMN03159495_0337 [Pseudomonas sp. NFR16]
MKAAQDYERVILHLFRLLGQPQPTVNPDSEVRLTLKCGVATDLQLLEEYVAFSASLKLPASPSAELLTDLLQANLDVTHNPAITIAAVAQTQEIIVWTKQHLAQANEREIVDLYDRFAHCVEAVQRCIARADASGRSVRRPPVANPLQQRATSRHFQPSSLG